MGWYPSQNDPERGEWPPTPNMPLPTASSDSLATQKRPSAFKSFVRRFLSPRWNAASDPSTHASISGQPADEWEAGELRVINDGRRSSTSSDFGGIRCLVVDNDLEVFTRDNVQLEDLDHDLTTKNFAKEEEMAVPVPTYKANYERDERPMWRVVLVDNVWPFFRQFAYSSFSDPAEERAFQQERWHTNKLAACAGACFLLLSTLLSIGFTKKWSVWNYYSYIGIAGFFNFSLPFLILFNTYLKAQWFYQAMLLGATWCWPFILAVEINNCGFFGAVNKCGGRNFLNFFALLSGIPTFALITLLQNRILHLCGITAFAMAMLGMFLGQPGANLPMWRNVILASVYHHILVWAAYFRERSDRQLFELRSQLKAQYRAVEAAQEKERRAQQSKKRFVSYIFHEVRVPLNTARLSLSNLDAEGAFAEFKKDQRDLLFGLDVSLRMMGKVLNDVLSYNRMEAGNLVLTRHPFAIHQAIQHLALAHRATAEASKLSFTLDLDHNIDRIGGVFVGDEMRFKQVCSNLVSNAFKFTQIGGVKLVTRLLYPIPDRHNEAFTRPSVTSPPCVKAPGKAVIRIEVHDTGVGLSLSDVRFNRLFTPFVQTELGRRQGGKGSGLGLALVSQIVKLSHGRLGVDSEPRKGSVFWFEMPFMIPDQVVVGPQSPRNNGNSLPPTLAPEPETPTTPATLVASPTSPKPLYSPMKRSSSPASPPPRMSSRNVTSPPPMSPTTPTSRSEAHASLDPKPERPSPSPAADQPPLPRYSTILPGSPPRSPSARTSTRKSVMDPAPTVPGGPLHCLVVDDDQLTRSLMSRTLTRLGHNVMTAIDGRAALEVLLRSFGDGPPIDVVFLDNQMPSLSGPEAVKAIRALPWDVYVVGCTGNALEEDQNEYLGAGADAIITKPVSLTAINEQLEAARERSEARNACAIW